MIWELLRRHALDRPNALALCTDGKSFSWKELLDLAEQTAGRLLAASLEPGDRIALVLPNGCSLVSALLAAGRIGAIAVPFAPDLHPNELFQLIVRSESRLVLMGTFDAALAGRLLSETMVQSVYVADSADECSNDSNELPPSAGPLGPVPLPVVDAPLICLVTSGTTGVPKRIERSHSQCAFLADSYVQTTGIEAGDRIYTMVPISHGHGFCSGFLASLQSGATLFIDGHFQRRPALEKIARERITVCSAVPFLFSLLADTRMPTALDYESLRLCVSGAGGMRRAQWTHVCDRLGFRVRQSYGSVETGALTINMDADIEATCESVGRPLGGVEIEIRQIGMATTDIGFVGHLYARSQATGRLLEGSQRQRQDTEGWIAMQDLGHFDSAGRLYLNGRTQGLVNVAGRKVSTREVELVLLGYSGVAEAKVLPCQDAYGEEAVRAMLVLKSPCSRKDLIDHCRRSLSEYKVPRVIDVVESLDGV